ncbi:hypothetical protein H8B09_26965 [Paenibacillus sp. PR3]|uniref:Uncharacterized protein n=1 Tax=Paenibacillus terricola TaxID=2763503 RepID=A0ABR8N2P0_9BACL|nr:hypothetical protein [Paenibacillus terricola]MBD3922423.1 hypothetical protein [Paenibacillus terricola]
MAGPAAGSIYAGWAAPKASSKAAASKTGKGGKPPVAAAGIFDAFLQLQAVVGAKAAARGVRYRLGEAKEPPMAFDEDFIPNPKEKPTAGDRLSWAKWGAMRTGADAFTDLGLRKLGDATEAYQHYRDGTGTDLVIDYEKAYTEDSVVRDAVDNEIKAAQLDAETISSAAGAGEFEMTGDSVGVGSGATENWQKTIGRHIIWGSAYVKVSGNQFAMTITIHEIDRYNFNRGEKDIKSGTPDDVNGRFAVLGWAKSFLTRGTVKRHVAWKRGDLGSSTVHQVVD